MRTGTLPFSRYQADHCRALLTGAALSLGCSLPMKLAWWEHVIRPVLRAAGFQQEPRSAWSCSSRRSRPGPALRSLLRSRTDSSRMPRLRRSCYSHHVGACPVPTPCWHLPSPNQLFRSSMVACCLFSMSLPTLSCNIAVLLQTAYSTPLGVSIITPFQLNVRTALRWVCLSAPEPSMETLPALADLRYGSVPGNHPHSVVCAFVFQKYMKSGRGTGSACILHGFEHSDE